MKATMRKARIVLACGHEFTARINPSENAALRSGHSVRWLCPECEEMATVLRSEIEPTPRERLRDAAPDLLTEAKRLVSEIKRRDGEGNLIPAHLYAALERAIAKVEGRP